MKASTVRLGFVILAILVVCTVYLLKFKSADAGESKEQPAPKVTSSTPAAPAESVVGEKTPDDSGVIVGKFTFSVK